MTDSASQRWDLSVLGVHHRVEITGSFSRTISWFVDDELVAQKKSSDDNVRLEPVAEPDGDDAAGGSPADARPGAVGVKFTSLGRPKRVTWYGGLGDVSASAQAMLGTGGIDLDPEPGSPAARREEQIRLHPRRYAAIAVATGVARVVVPVLLSLVAVRLAISIPWPDWHLPRIPWPHLDLPSIPWPDLPSIPWPDINLPDWRLPGWVRWLLDKANFIWPVVLAWAVARAEINRRRKQDAMKAELRATAASEADRPMPSPSPSSPSASSASSASSPPSSSSEQKSPESGG